MGSREGGEEGHERESGHPIAQLIMHRFPCHWIRVGAHYVTGFPVGWSNVTP